jgi:hypothetical protein
LTDIKRIETEILPEPSPIMKLRKDRYDLLNQILEEVVTKPLSSIKDLIQQKIEAFKLDNTIFELVELLKNRVTPVIVQYEKEGTMFSKCNIASILNAGWIFWLTHDRDVSRKEENMRIEGVESLDKLRKLCYESLVEISNLILKGIELTDFGKQFAELKQNVETRGKI